MDEADLARREILEIRQLDPIKIKALRHKGMRQFLTGTKAELKNSYSRWKQKELQLTYTT